MADNLGVSTGTDATVRTKDNAGVHLNLTAIVDETGATFAPVTAAGVKVDLGADNDVTVASLPLPAGASTLAEQQTQTTALQLLDDVVFVDNAAFTDGTSKLNAVGFYFDETAGTALTENDIAAARINANRAQVMVLEDDTTRGRRAVVTATGELSVNVQRVANSGTAWPTNAGTANAGTPRVTLTDNGPTHVTDNAAFTDGTTIVSMAGYIFDETAGTALTENDAAAARITANRAVVAAIEDGVTRARYATVTAANAVKVDGSAVTQPVSGTVTANLAAGTNTNEVVGDAANDAAIAGNPLSVGGRASIAIPTAAGADGRNFYAWLDLAGALFTRQRPAATSTLTNVASSATSVTLLAANNARIEAFIMNDSTSALMVKLGATASATSFTKRLAAGEFWPVPQSYRGVIDGIWQAVQGNARMTELTS